MRIFEFCKNQGKRLIQSGIEEGDFESRLIAEKACGISHNDFLLRRHEEILPAQVAQALSLIERRMQGEPLQYLLGEWEFMGLNFAVGEGVLIPRPETEQLCGEVLKRLKGRKKPVVFDLCSGSGCIGLSIKHYCENADVYLIEISDEALFYLTKNRENLGFGKTTVCVKGDVLTGYEKGFAFLPRPDVIVSNPPYIKSEELPFLQKEVQHEPKTALDGGRSGLIFYEALASKWLPFINDGGFIAVECGEGQGGDIGEMFSHCSKDVEIINDFNGFDRIVIAE